mgnify:CR=1 FL=1
MKNYIPSIDISPLLNSNFNSLMAKNTIKKISIDPSGLMADIDQKNNVFEKK